MAIIDLKNLGKAKQLQKVKSNLVKCEACNKGFEYTLKVVIVPTVKEELTVTYFRCTECNEIYIVSVKDKVINLKLKRQTDLVGCYKRLIVTKKLPQERKRLLEEYDRKFQSMKEEIKRYESKLIESNKTLIINYLNEQE